MSKKISNAQRLMAMVETRQGIGKLLAVMQALRDPDGGCPWDIKQTYSSILPYTIEEVYEVAETIETEDFTSLPDELGDLLFQVVFYAQIAQEEGRFDFETIANTIAQKLIRRHPHVFSDVSFSDENELNHAWEKQKQREREEKAKLQNTHFANDDSNASLEAEMNGESALDDIPRALPELKRAQKIQKRAAAVGFDWAHVDQVWQKHEEECQEVKDAAADGHQKHIEEEIGDLLFAAVNLSRHYGVDADMALRKANRKFEQRFRVVEKSAGGPLVEYDPEQLEVLWQKAKLRLS